MKRVEKFLKAEICPECRGSRISEKARAPRIRGIGLADACKMTLEGLNAVMHDLDVIRNADYVIDMGPGGGEAGGRIVAAGTPKQVAENEKSVTGRYIFYRNEGE